MKGILHQTSWLPLLLVGAILCSTEARGQNQKTQSPKTETRSTKSKTYRILKGQITDRSGEPLTGATVYLPKIKKHALADINGSYKIEIPKDMDLEVEFSFVGMKPVKKKFPKGDADLTFNLMMDDAGQLKEVIVTGIFNRSQGGFTGSATTISSQDILKVGNQNVIQSLKNLDPTLTLGDGFLMGSDPNSLPDLSIRGTSSLPADGTLRGEYSNNPNQPLFILDGFETTIATILDLDINRIESVTLLKDASSKAIYGSKAANGVIVIETKKLRGGQQRVTYNGTISIDMPDLTSYNLTNSLEKLEVEKADGYYSADNVNKEEHLLRLYNQRRQRALGGLDTYWLAKPLHTGVGQKHNLSIELGDSKSLRAVVSFTYNNIAGVMKGSERENISTTANLSYRTQSFIFRNILTYTMNKSQDSPYGAFSKYAQMNPYWEATDAQGNVLRWAEENIPNPMYDATIGTSLSKNYTELTNNLYAEWVATEELRAVLRVGLTNNKSGGDAFYPASHSRFWQGGQSSNPENNGLYELEHGQRRQLSADFNARWSKKVKANYFFINAGIFASETQASSYKHVAEGFSNSDKADITFARRYKDGTKPSGYESLNREASILLTASYDYDNKYIVDATIRHSASSLYGANNRWARSWSLGAGWNIHNEGLFRNIKQLEQLKLRASAGLTGNQNFNTNTAIATYQYYSGIVYGGLTGAYLTNMPNPDLKWEQKMDYNLGLDVKFAGLNLSLDIYRGDTKNMLTNVTIPTSTGFGIVRDNLGLVRNTGLELKMSYMLLKGKNGYLNLFGSVSSNTNRIVRLSESLRSYNDRIRENTATTTAAASSPVILYEDGRSMSTIWAVPSAGIDPGRGQEIFIKRDGSYTYEYDPSDLKPLGDTNPKYRGNFGFGAEYKGLGLNVAFTYLGGGQIYNSTLVERVENADISYNVDKRLAEGRWKNPGDVTRFKRYKNATRTRPTSRFIQDRTELNLSSLSLYYNVPSSIYKKLGMSHLRLALNMNDLFTLSSIQVERGTAYPFARKVSMSVTASF